MTRVLVTGLGSISALGLGTERLWRALVAGESGIGPVSERLAGATNVKLAARIPDYLPEDHFPAADLPLLDPFSQYALLAAREAVADAGLDATQINASALVLGTGCGGKETDEQTYFRLCSNARARLHPYTIPRGMPCAAVSQVSIDLAIEGARSL